MYRILPASPQKRGDQIEQRTVYFEITDPTKCLPNREVEVSVMVYKLRITPIKVGEPERKSAIVLAHEVVKALISIDEALLARRGEITRMEGSRLISMGTSSGLAKVNSVQLTRLAKTMYIPVNTTDILSAQIGWAFMTDIEYNHFLFSGKSDHPIISESAPKTDSVNISDKQKMPVDDSIRDVESPTAEFNREFNANNLAIDEDMHNNDWSPPAQNVHQWLRQEFNLPVLK
ncbi:hypothetical protein M422DRAFT_56301 [Sphaerobolus stellatus SS14]|uniref:Uncharacterized protein n=1 Tax=Sphaerobolus stellatus (strain SS14) TaxID=990650 RepID=A0A0C9T6W9_SPHS4|nr:hypothetical protein M422DRAFT_56301 [Sphaerobolus stellatus SS14]